MTDCADLFGPRLLGVLDCVAAALEECDRVPGRVLFAPGAEVAWDDCCEGGGQLWVRVMDIRPYRGSSGRPGCQILSLPVVIGVGIIRCAHTVTEQGRAPTATAITGDALNMTADASLLLGAIECCAGVVAGINFAEATRWRPLGPRGGCAGGEWEVSISTDFCGCG